MGQEAMAQNYPKIRDFLNKSNQNGKGMNSDFENFLDYAGGPSKGPAALQVLQAQKGGQVPQINIQSVKSVADGGQISAAEYFDNQVVVANERLIDRSLMNVVTSDQKHL